MIIVTIMNEIQKSWNNIIKEIDTNTFIIYWKMRNWKTLLWIVLALDYYPRIYSNFWIYKNSKIITKMVLDYTEMRNIRFSYMPGVFVFDEASINANSKDVRSKDLRELNEVLVLCWKKNLSLVWISQRFESIFIDARVLADRIIEVKKIKRKDNHPVFFATSQKQKGSKLEYQNSFSIDSISILKAGWITYNQLENSKMNKRKEGEKKENID